MMCHGRFLPHLFQFIIHYSFYHSRLQLQTAPYMKHKSECYFLLEYFAMYSGRISSTLRWDLLTQSCRACFLLVARLAYFSTLKMEAVCLAETSVNFYQTTRRHNPKIVLLIVTAVRTSTLIKFLIIYYSHKLFNLCIILMTTVAPAVVM
jgi:hypothetical protein